MPVHCWPNKGDRDALDAYRRSDSTREIKVRFSICFCLTGKNYLKNEGEEIVTSPGRRVEAKVKWSDGDYKWLKIKA